MPRWFRYRSDGTAGRPSMNGMYWVIGRGADGRTRLASDSHGDARKFPQGHDSSTHNATGTLLSMPPDLILGQQRVIGLLTFLATPILLIAAPGDVLVVFLGAAVLGGGLLYFDRLRSVGVGLVAGTFASVAVLLLLASMYSGVD